jgi:hypothetical protein
VITSSKVDAVFSAVESKLLAEFKKLGKPLAPLWEPNGA